MSGGMGPGRGGHMFGGDASGPTKPAGAALPLLRRAAKFFGPYRGRLSVIGLAILGSSILGLANPYLPQDARGSDSLLRVIGETIATP